MNILNTSEKGFTLIEFVVIMSIFGIMASISLFNFSGFSSNISLSNLTHDVALVIRQAQVSGISNSSLDNDPEKPTLRGIYMPYDLPVNDGRFLSEIFVFDDFVVGGTSETNFDTIEEIDTITIKSSDYISKIEYGTPLAACVADFRILFKRPDPNPLVYCGGSNQESSAKIYVTSSDGSRTRSIDVFSTGQISVD